MSALNLIVGKIVGILLLPFRTMHPLVGLTFVSLLTGVAMLLVFRWTSDQARIAAVKRRIHACLFEIRLFNDDLAAILRAQAEILRHNLTYVRLSFTPLVWMIVPLVLLIAQLQAFYGYAGLRPGEQALVSAQLDQEGAAERPQARLVAPAGLRVETEPLWIPSLRQLVWRIEAEREGDYQLELSVGGRVVTKSLTVSERTAARSPVRGRAWTINQLLYPAERPLDDGPVSELAVGYRDGGIAVLGWNLHWMIPYFVLSMVFAFALRNRFGVVI